MTLIGDKNFRGALFEADLAALDATIMPPPQRRARQRAAPRADPPIRQRIESIYWTAKDILPLSATARAPCTASEPPCLPIPRAHRRHLIALNHQLGLPSRALAQYIA